jgi:RNA polymerase sigma-70 factor (ECF subfamily)
MSVCSSEERELVLGLLHGSQKALRRFYKEYNPRLKGFIQKRVGLKEDVEEILHDTLLSALDSLALFSAKSSLFSWLCGIARHEIADFYRKQKIKTIVFSRLWFIEGFVSKALEPDAKLMRKEYEGQVKQALEMLLPHYREILELKYMDGLSVKQIAQKLGMSFKACESALGRARRAFEVAYEEVQ